MPDAVAVLTFHDSVELFLCLAAEENGVGNVGKREVTFMDYWRLLNERQIPLTQEGSMRGLNIARGAMKHQGTMPSRLNVEAFRGSATAFFEENTEPAFGVPFGAVSLLHLISYPEVRAHLEQGDLAVGQGQLEEALREVAFGGPEPPPARPAQEPRNALAAPLQARGF